MNIFESFIVEYLGSELLFHRARLSTSTGPMSSWGCRVDGPECDWETYDSIQNEVDKIRAWLNHSPPIPAVKAWLTSEYNKSMTLEEFLSVTGASNE